MYIHTNQFEPLLPSEAVRESVLEQANHLRQVATQAAMQTYPSAMAAVAPLLRKMNSYYTNRIEGQHTLPVQIDEALRQQFSGDAKTQRNQRLAIAHMNAEQWGEQAFGTQNNWRLLTNPDTITKLHYALFDQLPQQDLIDDNGVRLVAGALRKQDVTVGSHIAPTAASVPVFLQRFDEFYSKTRDGELAIVAVAAMHHRLAWIHPFADGNGRVARLHSHLLLHTMGLSNGAWSPLRGLARSQFEYHAALANADTTRQGDLDGRGNLSEKSLLAFIQYFLDVCIDQAAFMGQMLNTQTMKNRIAACLAYESQREHSAIRLEALLPMHYLFTTGSLERGQFKQMTGLAVRATERCLKGLLDRELLVSDSPKGLLRFGVPMQALRFYFPALWPEAEASVGQ